MLKDKRIRAALVILVLEWALVALTIVLAGESAVPLTGLILGLGTWIQLGLLFSGRRRRGGVFGQAQRAFTQGRYAEAAALLEGAPGDEMQAQTLLGNAYRQMGRLEDSEKTLRAALALAPQDAFPLYGLGRTRLAQGAYAEAASLIEQALAHKGRKAIRAELALAHFLAGQNQEAQRHAKACTQILGLEPYRTLIVNEVLRRLHNDSQAVYYIERNAHGLAYWEAEADRFSHMPYGEALRDLIAHIRQVNSGERGQS
jgi:tetratricopeptide (TPR) repeat protein